MARLITCKKCKRKDVEHKGHGLCKRCHESKRSKQKDVCSNCGEIKRVHRKTPNILCYKCHQELNKSEICSVCENMCVPHKRFPKIICKKCYETPEIICRDCKELKPHKAKGLCLKCYNKKYEAPEKLCAECGETNKRGGNLCSKCYHKQRNKIEECSVCGEEKLICKWIDDEPICAMCDMKKNKIGKCSICGYVKPLISLSKMRCRECYAPPHHACDFCGELNETAKMYSDKRMCRKCYNKLPETLARLFNSYFKRKGVVGENISKEDWLKIMNSTNWKCFYCEEPLNKKNRTIDHIVAISNGGSNDINNLVPCCRSCNSSKNDSSNLFEWLEGRHLLSKISEEKINIIETAIGDF